MNNTTDKAQLARWVQNWKETGEILERLRQQEIRTTDIVNDFKSFDTAFRSAIWLSPPAPFSGLVNLQDLLRQTK